MVGTGSVAIDQRGHRPAAHVAVAKPVSALSMCSFEPIRCLSLGPRGGHEAAGFLACSGRCGGDAACGARAGTRAAGWRVGQFFRSRLWKGGVFWPAFASRFRTWAGPITASRSIFASAPAIATTTENSQQNSQRSLRMLFRGNHGTGDVGAAGFTHAAHRVCGCYRPDRVRPDCQHGTPGRQRHRFHHFRICDRCEMAGAAQGDRACGDPCGRAARRERRLGSAISGIQAVAPSARN